jgi:DNA topoisomerase-1
MYRAFKGFVPEMATPEMTAKLEGEMDQIAAGEISKDEVLADSRKLLHTTYTDIDENSEELAKEVWKGMDDDKLLGPCPFCEKAGRKREDGSPNQLRIIDTKGGKRFVGCQGYDKERQDKVNELPEEERPDPSEVEWCTFSRPLPGRQYQLWKIAERCPTCGVLPRLRVQPFRGRQWELCLNEECPDMLEMARNRAERQAAREAREAAKAAKAAAGDGATPDGETPRTPARRSRKKPSPQTRRVKRAGSKTRSG